MENLVEKGTPRQSFRCEEYLWRKFKEKCLKKGYTASAVLRAFIRQVVIGKFDIEKVKPERIKKGERLFDLYEEILRWLESRKV